MKSNAVIAGLLATAVLLMPGSHAYAQSQTGQSTKKHIAKQIVKKPIPIMVTVASGDTLTAIATGHNSTYVRVFDANTSISDPNLIYPGDSLRIPDPSEQLADRALPSDAALSSAVAPTASQSTSVSQPAVVQSAPVPGCGDNQYANFIYSHESGCRTTAMSPNGCYGIGQACPASKLAYCGSDYACQNAFFTAYAAKYGGWAGAYAFWNSHGWW